MYDVDECCIVADTLEYVSVCRRGVAPFFLRRGEQ
jgi:hypothetical protein